MSPPPSSLPCRCNRLSIFAPADIVEGIEGAAEELDRELEGVPLKTHAVATIKELNDKVSEEVQTSMIDIGREGNFDNLMVDYLHAALFSNFFILLEM